MGSVITIILLQLIAAFVLGIVRSGVELRLDRVLKSPGVWIVSAGCVALIYASAAAVRAYDTGGAAASSTVLLVELAMLATLVFRLLIGRRGGIDLTFGSARFATPVHAQAQGLVGETGIRLGTLRDPDPSERGKQPALPLHYTGERHLLTVAPTRAGKGVSTIIPNLLTYRGSALIVDPKGENARITQRQRKTFGPTFVLDPFAITGKPVARFNPLDLLRPDSPTLIEDATLIAEALVVPETEGNARHFSEQAADLIKGFLLHLALSPKEQGSRTLGRLRDILTSTPKELAAVGIEMARSPHPIVSGASAMLIGKSENERSSLLSTAQRNTHFLDSPALRKNLAASDFRFADLKGVQAVSIYLVLPVDRLGSHNRWLRMIVALAVAELARTPDKPPRPVLFLLDEFAQLGRMQIIEDAYGLMAGLGLQMHAIVQDLSQLQRLYGEGWQTFVANAGVLQFFNTRDLMTAQYVSQLIGVTTRMARASSESWGRNSGSSSSGGQLSSSSGTNSGGGLSFTPTQRPLLFPDELMRMDRAAQILLVENADPILANKIVYHQHPALKGLAEAEAAHVGR